MDVFFSPEFDHHENLLFCHDKDTGLRAIIGIHNTHRGPALGGCRIWNYASESEAVTDVLRLSRGMTFKAALANLNLGGGKSVILGGPHFEKSSALFEAFGRYIERLNGQYIAGEDVGTAVEDMVAIRKSTSHVVGLPEGAGDPSEMTALGVYQSLEASVAYALNKTSLNGVSVAIQGLGHVGMRLCGHLANAGAALFVTDIDPAYVSHAVDTWGARAVPLEDICTLNVDVLAPCALGAVIHDHNVSKLRCKIIVGCANNQLSHAGVADALAARNILYGPDYVVNAGGLISVSYEKSGYDALRAKAHVARIPETLLSIYEDAHQHNISTESAAQKIAQARLK